MGLFNGSQCQPVVDGSNLDVIPTSSFIGRPRPLQSCPPITHRLRAPRHSPCLLDLPPRCHSVLPPASLIHNPSRHAKLKINDKIVRLGPLHLTDINIKTQMNIKHILAIGILAISKFKHGNYRNLKVLFESEVRLQNIQTVNNSVNGGLTWCSTDL